MAQSALYVSGRIARRAFVALEPYLDFAAPLCDLDRMENSLKGRRIKADLWSMWDEWEGAVQVRSRMKILEERRVELAAKMREGEVLPEMRQEGRQLREEQKRLMKEWGDMEEGLVPRVLQLPNYLHPETPRDNEVVVYTSNPVLNIERAVHHLDFGKKCGVLKPAPACYHGAYYLLGQAAMLEQAACRYFRDKLSQAGFAGVVGSDFCKSNIVEGCGMEWDNPKKVFQVEQDASEELPSRTHLVGSASLPSVITYVVRTRLDLLPVRLSSIGRTYTLNPSAGGLTSSPQRTSAHAIAMTSDLESEAATLLTHLTQWYSELGLHFRITLVPAHSLRCWEMSRTELQLWMAAQGCYVKAASLSQGGEYVSRRLRIYGPGMDMNFPGLVSMEVADIWCLLAALMEAQPAERPSLNHAFVVPKVLQDFWPGIKD